MPNYQTDQQMSLIELEYADNYNDKTILWGEYGLDNEFLRLPKTLDLQPLKLLGLILSKIKYTSENRVNGILEVECTLSEIRKACGVDSKDTNFEYYKNVARNLIKSSYVEGTVDGIDIMGYAVPVAELDPNADQITFKFNLFEKFLPYFQNLATNYTVIQLENTKKFKSRFSYVLYMNLLSWREINKEGFRFYTTKQLKEMFGLSKEDYCRKTGKFDRNAFERYTIEPAIKEINELTNMKVQWKKNYKGKRVVNYQFNFIELEPIKL